MSIIKDKSLAKSGHEKIDWVKSYMPVLSAIEQDFKKNQPFAGKKIAMSIHLEAKTAYLATVLKAGGADVYSTGCNPLSTQDDVAALIGKSRPAVANTLRLLTLAPEVVGLIESGRLSAGHARTLVKVPQNQQHAFAEEAIKRGYSVREMERAVKAFLTPPEVLQKEKEAKATAKGEELKAFVERMRSVFRTKVSLIGNDKKGRIYIDYYSPEDLYRFEELLDMIESYDRD